MDSENPYASPRYTETDVASQADATIDAAALNGARRWRKYLMVRNDAELPCLCAKCGRPTNGPLRRKSLTWSNVWNLRYWAAYAPMLIGILVLRELAASTIAAWAAFIVLSLASIWMFNRWTYAAMVYYRLCNQHEARRRHKPWLAALFLVVGIGAFVVAVTQRLSPAQEGLVMGIGVGGVIALVLAILSAVTRGATFGAYRIEGELVWLKDLPPDFLARIPELSDEELAAWRRLDGTGEVR